MPTKYTIIIDGVICGSFNTAYQMTETEIIKLKDLLRSANRVLESDIVIKSESI